MACPVCKSEARLIGGSLDKIYECSRCGTFHLTFEAGSALPAEIQTHRSLASVLSHFIRKHQYGREPVKIDTARLEALRNEPRMSPAEQREALILWIGDNQPSCFEDARAPRAFVAATIGAEKTRDDAEDGLQWLYQQLVPEGIFFVNDGRAEEIRFSLTMKGWERYGDLRRRKEESRTIFMAMQFGDAELDSVVDDYFRPAVAATGYILRRVNDNQGAGLIDDQIRVAIRTCALLIADLTHHNRGAYFEAGFAEGLGLDVIYTCRADVFKKEGTHFDANHMLTVLWDPAIPSAAAQNLKQTIRNSLPLSARMTD